MLEPGDELLEAYRRIVEYTSPRCAVCPRGNNAQVRCCDSVACETTRRWAFDRYGIVLKPASNHPEDVPFLGESGCIVAPHLRPSCSMHLCPPHDGFDPEYLRLKQRIEKLESIC